jgi:hypothetical protein
MKYVLCISVLALSLVMINYCDKNEKYLDYFFGSLNHRWQGRYEKGMFSEQGVSNVFTSLTTKLTAVGGQTVLTVNDRFFSKSHSDFYLLTYHESKTLRCKLLMFEFEPQGLRHTEWGMSHEPDEYKGLQVLLFISADNEGAAGAIVFDKLSGKALFTDVSPQINKILGNKSLFFGKKYSLIRGLFHWENELYWAKLRSKYSNGRVELLQLVPFNTTLHYSVDGEKDGGCKVIIDD